VKNNTFFEPIKSVVHNVVVGKLWIDHYGVISITSTNPESPYRALLKLKQCGWFSKNYRDLESIIYKDDIPMFKVYGKWNDKILGVPLEEELDQIDDFEFNDPKLIWENDLEVVKGKPYKKYKFSQTTLKSIEIDPSLIGVIGKSDSRYRPDRLALEKRDIKTATVEKKRLEEIQRKKRKFREENDIEYVPKYFENKDINGIEYWAYNFLYDKEREKRAQMMEDNNEMEIEFIVDDINFDEINI